MNPIRRLKELGQSLWLDLIQRGMLASGEMERLRDEGISGLTSNPTLFEQAITRSNDYDASIQQAIAARPGATSTDLFYALSIADIQRAADVFRPVYEAAAHRDGLVSIEVSPELAHDVEGTVTEAHSLWQRVGRPNLMVKVPATVEGLPVIRRLTADGVNINVTLLFAVDRYREVVNAYLDGLESRLDAGKRIDGINSVASFFVSRVDTKVDKLLDEYAGNHPADREQALALRGEIAIANAKTAYREFRGLFTATRFEKLQAAGARVQRLLWGSTGTKNPAYSDVLYVDSLIGPDTINTVPLATYRAFRDHGSPRPTLEEDMPAARAALDTLARLGIDLAAVTRELENEGVDNFQKSYRGALAAVQHKAEQLAATRTTAARRR